MVVQLFDELMGREGDGDGFGGCKDEGGKEVAQGASLGR